MKPTETPTEDWEAKARFLEAENLALNNRVNELTITLQIANERWVDQVNENTALEVRIRMSERGIN